MPVSGRDPAKREDNTGISIGEAVFPLGKKKAYHRRRRKLLWEGRETHPGLSGGKLKKNNGEGHFSYRASSRREGKEGTDQQ